MILRSVAAECAASKSRIAISTIVYSATVAARRVSTECTISKIGIAIRIVVHPSAIIRKIHVKRAVGKCWVAGGIIIYSAAITRRNVSTECAIGQY